MLRYLDVLADEARRMRIARISRGDDPRFLWQVQGVRGRASARCSCARSSAASGSTWRWSRAATPGGCRPPGTPPAAATGAQWAAAATVPAAAVAIAATAVLL